MFQDELYLIARFIYSRVKPMVLQCINSNSEDRDLSVQVHMKTFLQVQDGF